jgi:hypothetical protein
MDLKKAVSYTGDAIDVPDHLILFESLILRLASEKYKKNIAFAKFLEKSIEQFDLVQSDTFMNDLYWQTDTRLDPLDKERFDAAKQTLNAINDALTENWYKFHPVSSNSPTQVVKDIINGQ